jgi:hypothetical protein
VRQRELTDEFIRVPLSETLTPKNGRICCGPAWWYVTENDEVLFFRKKWQSPQCNQNLVALQAYPIAGCKPVHLDMAFIVHHCADYA